MESVRVQLHVTSADFAIGEGIDPVEGVNLDVSLPSPPSEGEVINVDLKGKTVRGIVHYYDEDKQVFIVILVKPGREPIFRQTNTNVAYSIMAKCLNYYYLTGQEDYHSSLFDLSPPTRLEFTLAGYLGLQFCFSGIVFTRHDSFGNIDFSTGAMRDHVALVLAVERNAAVRLDGEEVRVQCLGRLAGLVATELHRHHHDVGRIPGSAIGQAALAVSQELEADDHYLETSNLAKNIWTRFHP